jgi:hypothetical protein
MANGLDWKTVELQIENLAPGILLTAELWSFIPGLIEGAKSTGNSFVDSTVFVAASYAIGLLSSLLSRALVDSLSERGPRAWLFECFVHGKREELVLYFKSKDTRFNEDYNREVEKRKWKLVADWNAIYRAALRTTTRSEEVDRRRVQGRVVRNLFFPIIVASVLATCGLVSDKAQLLWALPLAIAASVVLSLFLYAYAELINMAEAHDITRTDMKESSKK